MANNQENLIPMSERSKDEVRQIASKGGVNSGIARREKATMKKTLEMLLNEKDKEGKTYKELTTLGLLKGAIGGKAENYKVIVEMLGELENNTTTPDININIVDNSSLEKALYEGDE